MTILLTTHYLDEAERLSDRIAIMRAGRIVASGSSAELIAALGDQLLELRVHGDPGASLASLARAGIAGRDAFAVGSTLIVPAHDRGADEVRAAVVSTGADVLSAVQRRTTLDDVYLWLTGDDLAEAA